MRVTDPDLDTEVAASSFNDRLEVNAWYDGELVAADLQIVSWSISWDATREVQAQTSWQIADPDGTLAPWTMADSLAPGGAQLQVTWISGSTGTEVPLGWYRIREATPQESWRLASKADGSPQWTTSGGGTVPVQADDLTCIPGDLDRLDAEPVVESTSLGEVVRLLSDTMPVTVDPAVVDRNVSASLVYEDQASRMSAVTDHLTQCSAVARMGPTAELEVVPEAPGDPVWTIAGGRDGVLIEFSRSMSDDGVYNAVVSTAEPTGTGEDAVQLVGRDYLDSGPLRFGGPFGNRKMWHQSPATTQAGVDSDARTTLANRQATGEVVLTVTCLMHPGLQLFDVVTLVPPSTEGEFGINGRVVSMSIGSAGSEALVSKQMVLGVAVTADDMDALAIRARTRG